MNKMKTLSKYLIVIGLFVLGKFFGEIFHIVIPFLDWNAIFMFWAGYLVYVLLNNK